MSALPLRVLYVDCEPRLPPSIRKPLERAGIQVATAQDGAAALGLLHNGFCPEVLLAALDLPGMDGLALLQAVRTNPEWYGVSVVLLTDDQTNPDDWRRAMELGADGFLSRPLDATQMIATIRNRANRIAWQGRSARADPQMRLLAAGANGHAVPTLSHAARVGSGPATQPSESAGRPAGLGSDISSYWQVLRRRWSLIFVCTLWAVAIVMLISSLLTPIYAATATIRVAVASGGQVDWGAQALFTRLSNTYVEIARSRPVMDDLVARLGRQIEPSVEVKIVPETELLRITATDPDPALARDVANTLADIMAERSVLLYSGNAPTAREILAGQIEQARRDLDQAWADYNAALAASGQSDAANPAGTPVPSGALEALSRAVSLRQEIYADLLQRYESARINEQLLANAITVIEPAALPTRPATPNVPFNAVLGLVGGLTAGVVLSFVLESLSSKLRSVDEIRSMTDLPILGQVPLSPRRSLMQRDGSSPFMDACHALRVRLFLADEGDSGGTIMVTSPEPGTGKTTIASALAVAMAESGLQVALIDADLRLPNLHQVFGLSEHPGLYEVLTEQHAVGGALQSTSWPTLRVMTGGQPSGEVTSLMSQAAIQAFLAQLRECADHVVIDAPAYLSAAHTAILARHADRVLVIVGQDFTERGHLHRTLEQLAGIEANVAGLVINGASAPSPGSYYSRRTSRSKGSSNRIRVAP